MRTTLFFWKSMSLRNKELFILLASRQNLWQKTRHVAMKQKVRWLTVTFKESISQFLLSRSKSHHQQQHNPRSDWKWFVQCNFLRIDFNFLDLHIPAERKRLQGEAIKALFKILFSIRNHSSPAIGHQTTLVQVGIDGVLEALRILELRWPMWTP